MYTIGKLFWSFLSCSLPAIANAFVCHRQKMQISYFSIRFKSDFNSINHSNVTDRMPFVAVGAYIYIYVCVCYSRISKTDMTESIWNAFFRNAPKNALYKLDVRFFEWFAHSGNEIYAYNTLADMQTHIHTYILMHAKQFVCVTKRLLWGIVREQAAVRKVTQATW